MGIVGKENRNLRYGRFCSEAGYQQSWPPKSDMLKFLEEDQLFPLADNIYWLSIHNAMVASIPDVQHPVYGVPQNVDELIRIEMLHNVIGWQAQLENTRLERFKVSGCLFWALNDLWPTTSWSMINWYGTCKNHYYAFKKAAAPLQAIASQQHQILLPGEAYDLEVCLVNDFLTEQKDLQVVASIYLGEKANKVYRKEFVGSVGPNAVDCLGRLDWAIPQNTNEHNFILILEVKNQLGEIVAKNEYVCQIGEVKKDGDTIERVSASDGFFGEYRLWEKNVIQPKLLNLPSTLPAGTEKAFEIQYTNNTTNIIMGLETLITNLPKGVRLYLDDNYIHLLPGQQRTIKASLQNTTRSNINDQLSLKLQSDALNIELATQTIHLDCSN